MGRRLPPVASPWRGHVFRRLRVAEPGPWAPHGGPADAAGKFERPGEGVAAAEGAAEAGDSTGQPAEQVSGWARTFPEARPLLTPIPKTLLQEFARVLQTGDV